MRFASALLIAAGLSACAGEPRTGAAAFDTVIVNGTLYDGTGASPRPATIGIRDGRIAWVGPPGAEVSAHTRIDAKGLAVAPGFIDPHSHVPESLDQMPGAMLDEQDITQGVTTIVMGPDGELSPAQLRTLIARLEARGSGPNIACYVGHNGIRRELMSGVHRPANAQETAAMAAQVRDGMALGCVGLSTGLMYDPGMYSDEAEVQALAREVAPFGGSYDSHTRDPGFHLMASEEEAVRVGLAAGIPVKLAHEKAVGLINKGKIGDVIAMVEAAQHRGQTVVADQYPYDGATTRYVTELFLQGDGSIAAPDALRTALADPAQRSAIRAATEQGVKGGFSWIKAVGYGSMRVIDAPGHPELIDRNVELLARDWGLSPFDTLARLAGYDPRVRVTLGSIDEADIRTLMVRPWVMIGSDGFYADAATIAAGKAHPRSWGSFTRVLGHYSRDVGLFPLEEAIRKMTSFPADHLGLSDRGRIAPGKAADVVIFDPRTIDARATYLDPSARSVGIVAVLVNGVVVFDHGRLTGAAPGRFVKRQQPTR